MTPPLIILTTFCVSAFNFAPLGCWACAHTDTKAIAKMATINFRFITVSSLPAWQSSNNHAN